MLPDWAPSVHPLLVHFPIALFFLAVAVDALSYFGKKQTTSTACAFLYALAGATAIAAFFSGRQAADLLLVSGDAIADLNQHADWGQRTAWLLGLIGLFRLAWLKIGLDPNKEMLGRATGFALTLAGVIGLYFVWETAERGAKLVFLHGLGTAVETVDPLSRFASVAPTGGSPSVLDDGSWNWTAPTNLSVFARSLEWIQGDSTSSSFGIVRKQDGSTWLSITTNGLAWVVFPQQLHQVEATAHIDRSDFSGRFELTYNTVDSSNFGSLGIDSAGRIRQVIVTDGVENELQSASTEIADPMTMHAVSADTHYRGYLNGNLVTHGHAPAANPGSVGIRIDGVGTVLLQQIAAVGSGNGDH